jgi:hypothetical protein
VPRWDSASKDKQRLLIQQQRPWLLATGPRTDYGRSVSSKNAAKKHRRCQSEPLAPTSMSSDVTFVSHLNDTDRPLKIGDRVKYIGGYQPTFDVCQGLPLKVVGFDEAAGAICASQQRFAIACRTAGGKLIWIYRQDLQRCPDGRSNQESGNQS